MALALVHDYSRTDELASCKTHCSVGPFPHGRLATFVPELKGKPGKISLWSYPVSDTPIASRSSFRAQVMRSERRVDGPSGKSVEPGTFYKLTCVGAHSSRWLFRSLFGFGQVSSPAGTFGVVKLSLVFACFALAEYPHRNTYPNLPMTQTCAHSSRRRPSSGVPTGARCCASRAPT